MYLSIYHLSERKQIIMRDFLPMWKLTDPKWSHSFCKTSSKKGSQLQIQAIRRNLVHSSKTKKFFAKRNQFFKLTTSKTKHFCEASFKLSAEQMASCQCVSRFCHSISLKYCACHEKVRDATHVTPLRKSAPWPPTMSGGDVSCTAPATRHVSLQILFKHLQTPHACHRFRNCYKPSSFCRFRQARLPKDMTVQRPKMVRTWCAFTTFDFQTRFAPQRVRFFHIATSKSGPNVVCFENVLRATTAYTFFDSPTALRQWCAFNSLTSMCASCHNRVHFVISHPTRWLCTRRFSEPTFRPSGASKHWKNNFRTVLPFRALWSAFFFPSLRWLFPPLLLHLCICRKFDF